MNTELREERTELRERAILPVLIPLVAIVITEIIVFSMSRILLATGGTNAAIIGLAIAVAILVGASFVAARPRMSTGALIGALALLMIVAIGVGGYAATQKPFYEKLEEASRPTIEVGAADLVFDVKTLELSPDGTVIDFNNADAQPHNIAVYQGDDATGSVLFKGAIINAGASTEYEVPELEVGVHYFQCDVHPNMNGKAVVEEGAGTPAHEGAHD